ncbi:MAG: RluA family pseudouridine synthase [Sandaracinaceae bacterium]
MSEAEAGERLDRLLARRVADTSRSTFARWIKEGRVTIDGVVATAKQRPAAGQRVIVRPSPPPPTEAIPQDLPIAVIYEDEHLLVVDKAPGMVVHPAPGHPDGTLVNAVLHHFGVLPGEDAARPGIVHRLDAGTSGVMVVARTAEARDELVRRFAAHDIERAYLAIAVGRVPAKVTYDTLHGRHPRDRKRFTSKGLTKGKRAVTHVERLRELRSASLVRCTLETGRTHQIRVHLADAGFPLLGDPLYGRPGKDPVLRAAGTALGRQALHAAVLGFAHPITGAPLRFETDPPEDFQRALVALAV